MRRSEGCGGGGKEPDGRGGGEKEGSQMGVEPTVSIIGVQDFFLPDIYPHTPPPSHTPLPHITQVYAPLVSSPSWI